MISLAKQSAAQAAHSKARIAPLFCVLAALGGCWRQAPELGRADYAVLGFPSTCDPRTRNGPAGATERVLTSHGIPFSVRTPANYDPAAAHPLLVIFAPGGRHRYASERFYRLTREATGAGFLVAYPDHLRLSLRAFDELGQVPGLVAARWCVDRSRVYLAGHSDGGTTAAAVVFLGKSSLAPRAIVASAAGIREQDLDRYACPSPVSVMVVHSRQDHLFPLPAYGKDAARWWAACGRCRQEPSAPDADGCVRYDGCDPDVQVRYCETSGPHASWPAINSALLAFLSAAPYTQRKGAENAQTSELPGPSPGSR